VFGQLIVQRVPESTLKLIIGTLLLRTPMTRR